MKKLFFPILLLNLCILALVGCNQNTDQTQNSSQNQNTEESQSASNDAESTVVSFLDDLKHENYTSAKTYYAENLDNMANFRNQVEDISPAVANEVFSKLADFEYKIERTSISQDDPTHATVFVTMDYYDVGNTFEASILEYLKTDIEMTYDGKNGDDITKKADELIIEEISSSKRTTVHEIPISLTLEDDNWTVDKMSENPELLNALSGNILQALDLLLAQLSTNN